jgi:YfiR/HmsC-like
MKLKITTLFLFLSIYASAQNINYKLASLYVYNFTKYIDWPSKEKTDFFTIGVFGETPAFDEFKKMASTKKEVSGKKIVVEKMATVRELETCDIIYIPASQSHRLKEIKESLKGRSVLIITEKPGMAHKGAGINLFLDEDDDNKLKFELNRGAIEAAGLHVSSQLVNLGISVK